MFQLRYTLLVFLFLLVASFVKGQYVHPKMGHVFDDTVVPRVDILIEPQFLDWILDPINIDSYTEYPATFLFTKNGLTDTVQQVGFRLRGNTSRAAGKKSFKISFNSNISGQKYKGLEKMNLNGEHNDPSITRSKLCWDLYTSVGIPGARANHVAFYINDEYRGLYANIEHIDEEFLESRFTSKQGNLYKCLYPADLKFKGEDPDLYKEVIYGRRAYQLQTNRDADDYSDLAHFIDVLNHTEDADFQCRLESVFDVELYLKTIALDILSSNWDGAIVNINNFYLYRDPQKDRFVFIPYDLDNTMGIGWGSTQWATSNIYEWSRIWAPEGRAIYDNIMAIPEYRNKVSYYIERYTSDFFNNLHLDPYLDTIYQLLLPYREEDQFAALDYGWRTEAFTKSFTQGVANHDKLGLKPYIAERTASARAQLDLNDPNAIIEYSSFSYDKDSVTLNILVNFPWDITGSVGLFYRFDESEWNFVSLTSSDDKFFTHTLYHSGKEVLDYYFKIENFAGDHTDPQCDYFSIPLSPAVDAHPVINELMASNATGPEDNEGEHEDWIELYNSHNSNIDLNAYFLTDNRANPGKWNLGEMQLNADSYVMTWADEDGHQGSNHSNFKLSKGGEFLGLYYLEDGVFFAVDSLTFPSQETDVSYGRLPNGSGPFQKLPFYSPGFNNESSSAVVNLNDQQDIDIYPNPTTDYLVISSELPISSVDILDISGQWMSTQFFNSPEIKVDLTTMQLKNGSYFIQVNTENKQVSSHKIVYLSK